MGVVAFLSELLGRSATARRVLDLLVSAPGHEIHTREIARRVDADPHATQLALDHLLQAGALLSRRVGNLRLWSVNPESDRVAAIRGLLRRESRVAQLLSDGLEGMRTVRFGVIFGSFASALDDVSSDIDVLIVGDVNWDRLAKIGKAVSDHIRRETNFVVWSEDELLHPKAGQRRLLEGIVSRPRIMVKGDEHEFIASGRGMAAEIRDGHHTERKRREGGATEARRSRRARR
jgi:predicted nucleotidyltransferase